jgi:hypothetical protein
MTQRALQPAQIDASKLPVVQQVADAHGAARVGIDEPAGRFDARPIDDPGTKSGQLGPQGKELGSPGARFNVGIIARHRNHPHHRS